VVQEIVEWVLIIYMEIAVAIMTIVFSLFIKRAIRNLPLSSLYIPYLLIAFGLFLLTIGIHYQEGAISVAGLILACFWLKYRKPIEELKEIEALFREYLFELQEAWYKECIYVLREHLKKIKSSQ